MGNCVVIQGRNEEIEIMGMDAGGEILKQLQSSAASSTPKKVQQDALHSDHGAAVPAQQHLLPAKAATSTPAVVRVKLVIRKQELKRMLHKEAVSLDDMVLSLLHKEAAGEQETISCRGWRPALGSIPEGSDY
ncbi:hypothetical protein GUJ93_ZPchr0011g27801 [Zizania palustris]|uniref:Uncharacterized protein n=1 Tax=Zizania palustris TaxID=103762 RepID=A0A8J5WHS2_ZIZPA|nr:hypothetical protein GUJ93_ZPchr0011g27801 [Zizania palustris]